MKKIIAYIDRNYNLIFNKSKCISMTINWDFNYNDIVNNGTSEMRYLGNGWYKLLWKNKQVKQS